MPVESGPKVRYSRRNLDPQVVRALGSIGRATGGVGRRMRGAANSTSPSAIFAMAPPPVYPPYAPMEAQMAPPPVYPPYPPMAGQMMPPPGYPPYPPMG